MPTIQLQPNQFERAKRADNNSIDGCIRVLGNNFAPKQVPTVALNIQENCQLSIRLNARGGDECYAGSDHPRVHHFEIINS